MVYIITDGVRLQDMETSRGRGRGRTEHRASTSRRMLNRGRGARGRTAQPHISDRERVQQRCEQQKSKTKVII